MNNPLETVGRRVSSFSSIQPDGGRPPTWRRKGRIRREKNFASNALHTSCIPESHTLHPVPYTLYPTPCTLHPVPYTLHPARYTLLPTTYTLHPTPYTQNHRKQGFGFQKINAQPGGGRRQAGGGRGGRRKHGTAPSSPLAPDAGYRLPRWRFRNQFPGLGIRASGFGFGGCGLGCRV